MRMPDVLSVPDKRKHGGDQMTIKWKRWVGAAGTGMLLAGALSACGGGEEGASSTQDAEGEADVAEAGDTVKIGALYDITGGTGDVGSPYADGEEAYVEWLNENGGIDGVTVELIGEDYAYDISEGQRIYQTLRDRHEVAAVLGWGTADTEALRQQVANDQLPYFSAAYSENLKDMDESLIIS